MPTPLPAPVTDNHAHLEPFQRFPETALTLGDQVAFAQAVGVQRIVQCGCDIESARWTVDVAVKHPAVIGAVAIHPNDVPGLIKAGKYHEVLREIADMADREPRVRAIGETGLDHFRTGEDGWAAQRDAFRDHIAIAKERGLALQIHDRDAHQDVVETLLREGAPERTVFHCFSGDRELARMAAANGWRCSFGGTTTFKSSEELRLAVSELPKELVLVETDSPYLTPEPFRGRANAPYMAALTMATLAERMGLTLEKACRQIQTNTTETYGDW
jgi:TatD DNase family protein